MTALHTALRAWQTGRADPIAYDSPLAASRQAYAALVNVEETSVAVGSQVSAFAGLVAASLPSGSEVLTATGDFTSILFPFHAQAARGVKVREVALEQLADAVTAGTTLVSVSAVQSADGRLVDLGALQRACAGPGRGCCWTPPKPWAGCPLTPDASPTPSAGATSGCSPPGAPPT
ncbi:MAG: hypothetical protein ACR2K2_00810 [Mycobacteriales bacterium]